MRIVYRYLGYLLIISAVFRIIPVAAALYLNEPIMDFVLSFLFSLIAGFLLVYVFRENEKEIFNLKNALILATFSFIVLPLIGAFTYLPYTNSFVNALFESVSGYTTTGMTVFSSLGGLPDSLLLWRAMTQWLGGIGIITFFLFLITRLSVVNALSGNGNEFVSKSAGSLYKAQGFDRKIPGGINRIIKYVLMIYVGYTFAGMILLWVSGMRFIEALGMAFTSISTGGFLMSDSVYHNHFQFLILTILMLLGAVSFFTHFDLITRKVNDFIFAFEKNVFLIMVFISILFVVFFFGGLELVTFQLISAFTTTGYVVSDIALLPELFLFFIFFGMLIGGSLASTSGGIKVSRVYYLFRAIPWYLKKLSLPSNAIVPLRIHGKIIEEKELNTVAIYIFLYVLVAVLGLFVFMIFGIAFEDSAFQILSALGTVGLQTVDIHNLNWLLKFVLMLAMILGRLEIFPVLILIKRIFTSFRYGTSE